MTDDEGQLKNNKQKTVAYHLSYFISTATSLLDEDNDKLCNNNMGKARENFRQYVANSILNIQRWFKHQKRFYESPKGTGLDRTGRISQLQ